MGTYPIGNGTAHAGNEGNAATIAEANHLFGNRLGGHEHTSDVDFKHGVGILGRVVEGGSFLLDASGGDQPIQTALGASDGLDGAVEEFRVTDIDATVLQLRAQFLLGTLLDLVELGRLDDEC